MPRRAPRPIVRHAVVAAVAGALVWLFWTSRTTWDPEMRLWKAVGDAAFRLLLPTLAIGTLARLAPPATRLDAWRRQLGIWFAIVALVHGVLVVHGWARWGLRRFLGYEVVPQLGREVRLEPDLGGVRSCATDPRRGRTVVSFGPASTSPGEIAAAIDQAGYLAVAAVA